jgi:hypothetical protein
MGGADTGQQNFGVKPGSGGGGGGGTGGSGGVGGGGSGSDDCSSFKERTILASPLAPVISSLSRNDRLALELTNGHAPVRALTVGGQVAGNIIPTSLEKLVTCMQSGTLYDAFVISVQGGACVVEIRARN